MREKERRQMRNKTHRQKKKYYIKINIARIDERR